MIVSITNVTTAVSTNVASSATNVTLFSASSTDRGRSIFNDSTAVLYIKFGATASTTSFKTQISAGALFEFPQPLYAGQVDGIWASASGFARLTSW